MLKRGGLAAMGLILVLGLAACHNREEERRQKMVQDEITVLDRQLVELSTGHDELAARTRNLSALLAQFNGELDQVEPRSFSALAANTHLRQLTNEGFGEPPGHWVLTHFWLTTNMLLVLMVGLCIVWVLFRVRQKQLEAQMNEEINRVIERLAQEANRAREKAPEPPIKPVPPAPPMARPVVAPKPEPRPVPPTPVKPAPVAEKTTVVKPKPTVAAKAPAAAVLAAPEKPAVPSARPREEKPAVKPKAKEKISGKPDLRKKPLNRAGSKQCKVKGCSNKHRSKGFCNKHYQQWRNGLLKEEIE